jgi:hypothetical protein
MWTALEIIFELLAELLVQVIGETLIEVGYQRVRAGPRPSHPVAATAGLVALGAVVGAVSAWLFPHRLTSWALAPLWSVLIAPLVVGAALHFFGVWRRRRGHATTHLATFYGGAAFAFAYAVTRLLVLAR